MKPTILVPAVALALAAASAPAFSAAPAKPAPEIERKIDWQAFLARHDLVWTRLPANWWEAPFLGNGMMGVQIRKTGKDTIQLDIGRGDVQSHGKRRFRLPIGHVEWKSEQPFAECSWRQSIGDAVTTGAVATKAGKTMYFRTFVHATRDLVVFDVWAAGAGNALLPKAPYSLKWVPEEPINPHRKAKKEFKGFVPPNPPRLEDRGDVHLCIQPLDKGELAVPGAKSQWATVTAWKTKKQASATRLFLTVKHADSEKKAVRQALEEIEKTSLDAGPVRELLAEQGKWWHSYYPRSFVSLPDPLWEGHYWIQMHKLASATRRDGMLIDNQGPWLQTTPWPGAWWNLNVQLTYWPLYTANRLDLGESLIGAMDRHFKQLCENVPEDCRSDSAGIGRATCQFLRKQVSPIGRGREAGNLLWACHNYWLHCRYAGDDKRLREMFYPLLKRCVNFYLHYLEKGEDGKLHIPKTLSPEYNFAQGPDTNYDLALLKWGLGTILETAKAQNIDEPRIAEYKKTLATLTGYPQDENGMMIADGVPFAEGHRHFSHLLMFYPLFLLNAETPGAKALADKSVAHWQSLGHAQGYSLTGASLISSAFGEGDKALEYLEGFKRFLRPNTLYKEAGPVIETPLSAAQAVQNMLLQSWGGVIRPFPAVPSKWGDVTFDRLRADGAFLVSGVRRGGKTRWVAVESLAGKPCRVKCDIAGDIQTISERNIKTTRLPDGSLELDIRKGETVILAGPDRPKHFVIEPVPGSMAKHSEFGLR